VNPTKKISILAAFPLHHLEAFGEGFRPAGHYATWLPQIAEAWKNQSDFEIHWLVMSELVQKRMDVVQWQQSFHVLPTTRSGRASTLFRADRKAIASILDEIQPDLVHGWGTEDVYGLAAALSKRPNIVSMQGILSFYVLKNRMAWRSYLQAAIELFVLWKAHQITTESEWGRQIVKKRNPWAQVAIVEYGVQKVFFETKWSPNEKKPLAIFVGSISPRKGIQDLVAAFSDPRLAACELVVVGEGEGRWAEELQRSAPSNVRWEGRKTAQETAKLMAKAWCLVLPTRADTSPNVVKEARVIGLPIVASPHGGHIQYVEDEANGFICDLGAPEDWSRAIRYLIDDISRAKHMGQIDQDKHRELLRPARTARNFLNLYEHILVTHRTN